MDDAVLEALAVDLESELVERKESASASGKIAEAICAFANDLPGHRRPGVIFVGLKDNGAPSGVPIDDRMLTALGDLRSNGNILPPPSMTVQKRRIHGQDVAVIIVEPSGEPPVQYKGRIWIRVGPRRGIASRDEERILTERRQYGSLPYDHRPVRNATLDDLDLDRIRLEYFPKAIAPEVLAENQRSIQHQLGALHLASAEGTPTVAALLLFARSPRRWIPGAYVQFVRFEGDDVTAPVLDQKEIDGPIPQILGRVDDIISANVRETLDLGTGLTDRRRPDYAIAALQQLLRNAIMHRSYEVTNAPVRWYWFSNRIEIRSPGGLFGSVTPETFGTERGVTDYRNPAIAMAMKIMGFVQQFGMGLLVARQSTLAIGGSPPEFQHDLQSTVAIVRSARARERALILDPLGVWDPPLDPAAFQVHRLLRRACPELDQSLRRRERAAWATSLQEVDVAVRAACEGFTGILHVFARAPYPLAAWLGACLDRYARALRVVLHLEVPGAGTWIELPAVGDDVQEIEPYWSRLTMVEDRSAGEGVVLALVGATGLAPDALKRLADTVQARYIYRLGAVEAAEIQDRATATGAIVQLRRAVTTLKQERSGATFHVLSTAPVAMTIELARLLPPSSVRSVVVYAYDPASASHHPVLDISSGKLIL